MDRSTVLLDFECRVKNYVTKLALTPLCCSTTEITCELPTNFDLNYQCTKTCLRTLPNWFHHHLVWPNSRLESAPRKVKILIWFKNLSLSSVSMEPALAGFLFLFFGICCGVCRTAKCTVITSFLSFTVSTWIISFLTIQIYNQRSRIRQIWIIRHRWVIIFKSDKSWRNNYRK